MHELSTVLVVDDTRISRLMLRENLEDLGLQVLEAADGDEAIELIRWERPGLVLSDILMPGCDGFELATRLRTCNIAPRPPWGSDP